MHTAESSAVLSLRPPRSAGNVHLGHTDEQWYPESVQGSCMLQINVQLDLGLIIPSVCTLDLHLWYAQVHQGCLQPTRAACKLASITT